MNSPFGVESRRRGSGVKPRRAVSVVPKEQWDEIMKRNGWSSVVEVRDNRYNQIIHMVSAANGAEEFYSLEVSAVEGRGVECRGGVTICTVSVRC